MATSGTLDSKLLRPDPLLLLPMLEDGDGDFPYSWNLRRKKKKSVRVRFSANVTLVFVAFICLVCSHLYGWYEAGAGTSCSALYMSRGSAPAGDSVLALCSLSAAHGE